MQTIITNNLIYVVKFQSVIRHIICPCQIQQCLTISIIYCDNLFIFLRNNISKFPLSRTHTYIVTKFSESTSREFGLLKKGKIQGHKSLENSQGQRRQACCPFHVVIFISYQLHLVYQNILFSFPSRAYPRY